MKSIIIYYSYGGNTRRIAEKISKTICADIAEIKTVNPYNGDYNQVVEQGKKEIDSGYMPKIFPLNAELSQYDTIILGTPVWWYTFAPAMKTFLNQYDLSKKTIYTFATNGGWIGHTFEDFANACPNSIVKQGLNIRFDEEMQITSDSDIIKWINNIK